jgi:hypothetical protein
LHRVGRDEGEVQHEHRQVEEPDAHGDHQDQVQHHASAEDPESAPLVPNQNGDRQLDQQGAP